jgi:hypothetical protein
VLMVKISPYRSPTPASRDRVTRQPRGILVPRRTKSLAADLPLLADRHRRARRVDFNES